MAIAAHGPLTDRSGGAIEIVNEGCEPTDAHLVSLCANGDRAALQTLYLRHASAVYNRSLHVLCDRTLAADITQDIFLRLWRQPERFDDGRGTLRTFLLTQAKARSIDLIRSDGARRARESAWSTVREVDVLDHADIVDRAYEVRLALATLPEHERRPVVLAFYQGFTYREVAEHLGVSEGTVKSRIRRALARLRDEALTW